MYEIWVHRFASGPEHVEDEDGEGDNDAPRAEHAPEGDHLRSLPEDDVRYKDEHDGEQVSDRDDDGAPETQQGLWMWSVRPPRAEVWTGSLAISPALNTRPVAATPAIASMV